MPSLIVADDYQEIRFLVVFFCILQTCVGFILPSLARLRTIYVPNELRRGMISLSLAYANAVIRFGKPTAIVVAIHTPQINLKMA